ncbi:MAG: arylsulfatase B [Planctomycetota bacterium]|jgi:arylsulfatase A-like enzyme
MLRLLLALPSSLLIAGCAVAQNAEPSPTATATLGEGAPSAASAAQTSTDDPLPPDIILILADDLGWGDWQPTGGPMLTPNLMRLCEEGTRLDRYYTYPLCTPTRAALMSGRSPMQFRMAFSPLRRWESRSLPRDVTTLPQFLKTSGYRTALVGKWHLGHMEPWMLPNQRGFDHFYGFVTGAIHYFTHKSGNAGRDWQRNGAPLDEKGYSTTLFGAEAARWIGEQEKDQPLFLYLPFNAPHGPLMAPGSFTKPYREMVAEDRAKYCGMVAAMDEAIGEVLAAVEARGRADQTMVIFVSDNGGSLRESGSNGDLRGNKGSTYEGAIRVPGVVRWPGKVPAGVVSHDLIDVMDWVPTLVSAAGMEVPAELDGQDVLQRLHAPTTDPTATASRDDLFYTALTTASVSYAVIRWPWKCVVKIRNKNGQVFQQLYRLDTDPLEETNLRTEFPELTEDLVTVLKAWMQQQLPGESFERPTEAVGTPVPKGWVEPEDWTSPPALEK